MSYCEYFDVVIKTFIMLKKITRKVKLEVKELIRQFEISGLYDEFEDKEKYKIMKREINKIRELIF